MVGEFADTVVFCLVAFGPLGAILGGGSIPWDTLLNYIVVGWVYKVLVEVVLLPVTYWVIAGGAPPRAGRHAAASGRVRRTPRQRCEE